MAHDPDKPRDRFPFAARIVSAMALGIVLGYYLGPRAEPLGRLGSVLIDLIKALAGPLLLFAVLDAFLRTRVRSRSAGLMIGISLVNATLALIIGLTLSNVLHPGRLHSITPPAGPPAITPELADEVVVALLKNRDRLDALDDVRARADEILRAAPSRHKIDFRSS